MLTWLSGGQSLQQLIASKQWDRAIVQLRQEIRNAPKDSRTRIQLADVLVDAGRGLEAVPILLKLAQDFGLEGSAGRAIAVLKKIERIQPGRADVQKALAALLKTTTKPSVTRPPGVGSGIDDIVRGPAQYGIEEIGLDLRPASAEIEPSQFMFTAPASLAPPPPSTPEAVRPAPPPKVEEDEEVIEMEDLVMPPPMSLLEIANLPGKGQAAAPVAKAPATHTESLIAAMDQPQKDLLDDLLNTIEEVLGEPTPVVAAKPRPRVTSPLFADFSEDDLFAVIQGLELVTYAPGDILIVEGDPGSSLFIVTSGVVKAFVRQQDGTHKKVREMGEGSFFGEISVLSGKARTASVTAMTPVEALVLERRVLDEMVRTHPSVRTTLEKFAAERLKTGK